MSKPLLRKLETPGGETLYFHRWVDCKDHIQTNHNIVIKDETINLLKEVIVTKALVEDNGGNLFTIDINQVKFTR